MKKLFFTLLVMTNILLTATCFAGAFAKSAGAETIIIGDVACYGEQALKQQFFLTFKDLMMEQLQNSHKVVVDDVYFNHDELKNISEIHMNAIVHSKNFVREKANIGLVRYYRNLNHTPKRGSDVYNLDADAKLRMNNIANICSTDYILFCNLKNAEVDIKHHNDSAMDWDSLKGTKVKLDIDYYLVNKNSGEVYAGTSSADKTSQVFDLLFVKYGKQFTTEQLLQTVLENQSKRIAEDITNKGIKKI